MGRIWLPVEVSKRELVPKALLAVELAGRGHEVIIGRDREVWSLLQADESPGVAFRKSVGDARERAFNAEIQRRGILLIAQDEEAGITYTEFRDFFSERHSLQHFGELDRFLCWTEDEKQTLALSNPIRKQVLSATGGLRTSIWGEIGRKFFRAEIIQLEKKFGPYVLFNTNFGTANSGRGAEDEWRYQQSFGRGVGRVFEEWLRDFEHEQKQIELVKATIDAVATSFDIRIVLRPHPGESPLMWEKFARSRSYVTLASDGPVSPLISGSEVVFQHRCTTGVESLLAEKPTIDLDVDRSNPSLESRNGIPAGTVREALDLLGAALEDKELFVSTMSRNPRNATERLIGAGTLDPVFSIAQEVELLAVKAGPTRRLKTTIPNQLKHYGLASADAFLGRLDPNRRYTNYKRGKIRPGQLSSTVNSAMRVLGKVGGSVAVKRIAPNTYSLREG